jgi:hypothetical protein
MTAENLTPVQEVRDLQVFHWILTLQWGGTPDLITESQSGTVNVGPGATRTGVLKELREHFGVPRGFAGAGVVLFFSLEPESLSHYFGDAAILRDAPDTTKGN